MTKFLFAAAFLIGVAAIFWIGQIFLGEDLLGLGVTILIGGVYGIGTWELFIFRRETGALKSALSELNDKTEDIGQWLLKLSPSLQNAVRLRIEGERNALPAPVVTPFLVGLLVMLGLLGTFVGMVDTLNGAVVALEGESELEAIRAGLAAPIEGLGLAFGTSVAGVAGSAMLGLLSTISRRERVQVSYLLDTKVGNELKHLSANYQQQLAFKAIQDQANALPEVAEKLTALAVNLETMTQDMGQNLLASQTEFQATVTQSYESLNKSVSESLKDNLSENEKLIRTSIQPMAQESLTQLNDAAFKTQQKLVDVSEKQLKTLNEAVQANSKLVQDVFDSGLKQQGDATQAMVASMNDSVAKVASQFQSNTQDLLDGVTESQTKIANQQQTDAAQFNDMIKEQLAQFQNSSQQLLDGVTENQSGIVKQQQADSIEFNGIIKEQLEQFQNNSQQMLDGVAENQSKMVKQQQADATEFSSLMQEHLAQFRTDESQRTDAAIERLSELESVVSKHLTLLGQSLEEPMTRLIETASQTPKAAADVIEKLRGEISKNIERDNGLLEERSNLMQRLESLSDAVEKNTVDQQQAIASLLDSSTVKLSEVSTQFGEHLQGEVSKLAGAADYFAASSVEISGLGDAFNAAVMNFSESNNLLIENLSRIEATLEQSNNRSDEQLNYYVAQAREVIDHNLLSHKEILDSVKQHLQTTKKGAA